MGSGTLAADDYAAINAGLKRLEAERGPAPAAAPAVAAGAAQDGEEDADDWAAAYLFWQGAGGVP